MEDSRLLVDPNGRLVSLSKCKVKRWRFGNVLIKLEISLFDGISGLFYLTRKFSIDVHQYMVQWTELGGSCKDTVALD